MTDLSQEHVHALVASLGVAVDGADLAEITHRLNAFHAALASLADLPLDSVEPVPAWIPPDSDLAGREASVLRHSAPDGGAPSDADTSVAHRSATDLASLIRTRALSPVALVEAYLERIERLDRDLRAYITVCGESALAEAKRAEAAAARGEATGALHGLPFAVKDQFDTAGVRSTSGSRLLADHVSATDAPVVARLRAAGANPPRQAQHDGVRPRRNARLPLRAAAQSVESRSRSGRLVVGVGHRRRRIAGRPDPGRGHGRLGALARGVVRCSRAASHLGARPARRVLRPELVDGRRGARHPDGRRRRGHARRDRRARSRRSADAPGAASRRD